MRNRTVLLVLLCLALVSAMLVSCSSRKAESVDRPTMNIDFTDKGMVRNGNEAYTYQVESGKTGVVSISIDRTSGKLDIDIYSSTDRSKVEYKGRDLDSATFSVVLTEPGEYKVMFTCKDYIGSYGVNWRVE